MNKLPLLVLGLVLGLSLAGCVTTQVVTGGPDPRNPTGAATVSTQAFAGPRYVVSRSDADPIVNLRVVFEAGSADDPVGKEGLTALTARLMAEATADLDASALQDALFPMAAELSVFTDKDTTVFVGRAHKDHEQALWKIMSDVLVRPRLDQDDFNRLRDEHLAFITSTLRGNNDEALQREALELALYAPERIADTASERHPYGHTPKGTSDALRGLTLNDVRAHMTNVFVQERVTAGIGGGASDALIASVKETVAVLPQTGAARAVVMAPVQAKEPRMVIIEKPSAGTAISLGMTLPQLSRSHPDYPALKLAETYFGEHRNLIGHLFDSMREVRGLNYGDYAYVEHFVEAPGGTFERTNITRRTQYFSMWIRPVAHDNAVFATRMTAWELSRFIARGLPDDATFERTKQFVTGYWQSKEQEPMRRLGYAIDRVLTGQPFDRDGLRERVQRLTRSDVNAAIARHLGKDGWRYVVVTSDAAAFKDAIVNGTSRPRTAATTPSATIAAEDDAIDKHPLGLGGDDVVVVSPLAVFAR